MVKQISGYNQYRQKRPARPHSDWVLSPVAMNRYIQYRLYLVEHQIEKLAQNLEQQDAPPFPTELDDPSFPDDAWASWASLNYLFHVRASLKDALSGTGYLEN